MNSIDLRVENDKLRSLSAEYKKDIEKLEVEVDRLRDLNDAYKRDIQKGMEVLYSLSTHI